MKRSVDDRQSSEDDLKKRLFLSNASRDRRLQNTENLAELREAGLLLESLAEGIAWANELREKTAKHATRAETYGERATAISRVAGTLQRRIDRYVPRSRSERPQCPQIYLLWDQTIRTLDQINTIFKGRIQLAFDLPVAGSEKRYREDRREKQLSFLVFYSLNAGYLTEDQLSLDLDREGSGWGSWIGEQANEVVPVPARPTSSLFMNLCFDGYVGEWFKDLWAHNRFLHMTEEALIILNEIGRSIFSYHKQCSQSEDEIDRWVHLVESLCEMHRTLRDSRSNFLSSKTRVV